MFRGGLEPWHLVVLFVVFMALFGYRKLPEATRSIGRSLRIFKSEMKGMHDEEPEKPAERSEAASPAVIEGMASAPAGEEARETTESAGARTPPPSGS